MRKITIFLLILLFSLLNEVRIAAITANKKEIIDVYTFLCLHDIGLKKDVFSMAIRGMKKLNSDGKIKNTNIITIIDYSQSCNKKRLYVLDLNTEKLLFNTYVAHGKNTGDEYAKFFSNKPGSLKSSLGFYVTEKPVVGGHTGFSLMLIGVEKGINDNAYNREIIIHSAEYVTENFIKKYGRLGRSWGCPVLPPELNKPIIETIKNGTCLFIYNPDKEYICNSSLVNLK